LTGIDATVTPTTSFLLLPGTTYWLGLTSTAPNGGGIYWSADLPGVAPTGIATQVVNNQYGPGTYLFGEDYPGTNGGTGSENLTYRVEGHAVPEPSAVVLCGVGLVGAAAYARRRKARA
jgi:hypothetical protein